MSSNTGNDPMQPSVAAYNETPPVERRLDIAILGAGVSGLAATIALLRHPQLSVELRSITIFDKQHRVGGALGHSTQDGYLVEAAAQGVLASRMSFMSLLEAAGLGSQALSGHMGLRRFLILDKGPHKLVAISANPFALVASGLLTLWGLIRTLCEPFVVRGKSNTQETLFQFVERRFGHKAAIRFIVPLATGIWGGGARRLLVRHVFPRLVELEQRSSSVIVGMIASMIRGRNTKKPGTKGLVTFAAGMETFPLALHKLAMNLAEERGVELNLRLGTEIASVQLKPNNTKRTFRTPSLIRLQSASTNESIETTQKIEKIETIETDAQREFNGVISTVPLWREKLDFRLSTDAQDVLPGTSQEETARFLQQRLTLLRKTNSHGLVVVALGGTDSIAPKQGFGALAPENSQNLLGVIFVHSVVPEHAPSGHFLYRLMLGGDRDPRFVERSNQDCLACARQHLRDLGLVTDKADFHFERVFKWPAFIPLQDENQDDRLLAISELEDAFPGLVFAGNYLTGVGVHDCLVAAEASVQRLAESLNNHLTH
jgi:oxygen-dependent protoporphyrinogen oxidase